MKETMCGMVPLTILAILSIQNFYLCYARQAKDGDKSSRFSPSSSGNSSTAPVQLMTQPDNFRVPRCKLHDANLMTFTFKVHHTYMMNDGNSERHFQLKFHTTPVDSMENLTPLSTLHGCKAIQLKPENEEAMIKVQCDMWNIRNNQEMKQLWTLSATSNNKTVWKYKEPMKPINYLYYCYKKHRVQNVRPFRYYENTRIDVSWKARSYDIVNYNLSHVITVLEDGNKKVQEHVVPQSQCNGPRRSCEYTVKNLNPCTKQMICITTNVIGMDASYQPTLQPACVTSHDVFRNCTTNSSRTKGKGLNTIKTIVLFVLLTMFMTTVVVVIIIRRRKCSLRGEATFDSCNHCTHNSPITTNNATNTNTNNKNNNSNNNINNKIDNQLDELIPRIKEPHYEEMFDLQECQRKLQDELDHYAVLPFNFANQTSY